MRAQRRRGRILLLFCLGALLLGPGALVTMAAPPCQAPQEVDVVVFADLINRWHRDTFRGYHFNQWISLGDITRFTERIADGDVQVYVDPVQVAKRDAMALYEDCVGTGCSTYYNDIVLSKTPDQIPPQTLWHEATHAIFDEHDSELLVSTDEIYAWYIEGVINVPLQQALVRYEEELRKGEACDQKMLDQYWKMFEQRMQEARNTVEGPITSDAQLEQLRQLTGFHVDAATIRQGYVNAGLDKCPAGPEPGASLSDLDLIFCIDVTGSMEDDIASVKAAASSIVNTIESKNSNYRVALIAYRDWDDSMGLPMFEDYSFSSDQGTIIANINTLSVGGGDDTPEAVFEVLMRAIDSRTVGGWRNGVNKQVILMGDAPPHNPSRGGLTPAIVAQAAEDADPVVIQAVVVGNAGVYDTDAVAAFRELAELTGGHSFEAADASQVPEVLQETIQVIQPPKPSGFFSTTMLVILGVLCIGLMALLGVVVLVLLLSRGKPRQPRYQAMPAGGMPAPGATPYAAPPYGAAPYGSPPAGQVPYGAPPPGAVPGGGPAYPAPAYGNPPYNPAQAPQPYPLQQPMSQVHTVPAPAQGQSYVPPPPAQWQGETVMSSGVGMFELVVEMGMDVGRAFPLKPHTRLGRASDNDIVLRDPQASRYHAAITLAGAEYAVSDLGSANGTRVNGVQIQQACPLRAGDVVTIGSQHLRVRQR